MKYNETYMPTSSKHRGMKIHNVIPAKAGIQKTNQNWIPYQARNDGDGFSGENQKSEIKNIVLVGFMGTGKSSVGKALAKKLNFEFVDTDAIIEKKTKMRIKTIFKKFGEEYFRDIESKVAKEVSGGKNKIIACGGGIVIREENINNLKKNGILICLTAKPEVILERVSKTKKRPLLQGNKNEIIRKIKKILKERNNFYKRANFSIDTSYLTKKEVIEKILYILSTT